MAGKTSDRVADQRKEIVDHVIEEMGKGGFSWLKPWADSASPRNPVTGSTYHGRNRMHLAVMAAIKGYNDPRWVTFNQAKKVGWKLQKGAKSCIVEKWKMYPVKDSGKEKDKSSPASDDTQNLRMIPRCVGYWSVFNASQFDGVPPLPQLNRNDDIEIGRLADDVKDSSRCPVREAPGNEAYYVPAKDMIAVPPRDSFASNEAFLVTLLHEMGHSTGHPNALGRDLSGTFGSKRYAFEELIAEFSSMFSASDLGLSGDLDPESDHFKQHVAYLQSLQRCFGTAIRSKASPPLQMLRLMTMTASSRNGWVTSRVRQGSRYGRTSKRTSVRTAFRSANFRGSMTTRLNTRILDQRFPSRSSTSCSVRMC